MQTMSPPMMSPCCADLQTGVVVTPPVSMRSTHHWYGCAAQREQAVAGEHAAAAAAQQAGAAAHQPDQAQRDGQVHDGEHTVNGAALHTARMCIWSVAAPGAAQL